MFSRWVSIENHYREKYINDVLSFHPQLADETFVITEKIHGSNFHWHLSPSQPIRAASRNNYLDVTGSFQGALIKDLFESHWDLLDALQDFCNEQDVEIRLYGELFGNGIQKGVYYCDDKRLLYFGLDIAGELQPFYTLELFVSAEYLVPVLQIADSLQEALDFDAEFNSVIAGVDDNICEGVVISPYYETYLFYDSPFYIKKKNEGFSEKSKAKKEIVLDEVVARMKAEFDLYVNDNRLQNVFSKHGAISSPKEIGQYIKLLLEDAKEDFLKDNDVSNLDAGQLKQVYSVGSKIANMLKTYM